MPTYRGDLLGLQVPFHRQAGLGAVHGQLPAQGGDPVLVPQHGLRLAGEAPASMARVGSFTGRTPESIPQGGSVPRQSTAAR